MPNTLSPTSLGTHHHLEARLLGGLALRYNDQPLPETAFHRRQSLTLLLRLLVTPSHRLPRDAMLEALWPEQDPVLSAANLRAVLSGVRAALPDSAAPDLVARLDASLTLHPTLDVVIDADQFETAATTALATGDPAALQAAVAAYGGPLLPSLLYEEWVLERRATLAHLYRQVLLTLTTETEVDPADIEARLGHLLAEDALDEPVAQALVRLLGAHGRRAEALRVYKRLVASLQEELGVGPSPETEALHAALLAPVTPPPTLARGHPRTSTPSHNLPVPLSSFVGRAWERAELRHLLDRARLLTLVGPGGCGKTRLAMVVAEERLAAYPDGVWLVELASIGSGDLVAQAVARALDLREEPDRPLTQTLTVHLSARTTLLLLDNCEHLLDAVAALADRLLRACPALRILATSRERLGLTGESAWPVPPLSLPSLAADSQSDATPSLAQLAQAEAVQLFLERARAVRPGFALAAEHARAVSQLCRRLDGIPLALELAAARVGALSVEQLAARLDNRFRLLTGGSRTALPRQQTLRASIDWSYELLTEPERVLLRRLAVFAGGWTLEAAEAICREQPASDIPSVHADDKESKQWPAGTNTSVLDLLAGLVEKSLVQVAERVGAARYDMLETVRQYGGERLLAAGEATVVRDRHLAWAVALAEEAYSQLAGPEQGSWLERVEAEHDNLRAALGWSLEQEGRALGLQLAGALGRFWDMHGHLSEGRRWLAETLAHCKEASAPAALRARALGCAGILASKQGDFEGAWALLQESLALLRELGDTRGIAASLVNLGCQADRQGDLAQARALHEEALALFRDLGNKPGVATTLINLGLVVEQQGDSARAQVLWEEALELFRELGNKLGIANALSNLGIVAAVQGDLARERALIEEGLALYRELGARHEIAIALGRLGDVAVRRGDYEQAWARHQEGLALKRELGDIWGIAISLGDLGSVAEWRGDYEGAWALHQEGLALKRELGDKGAIAESLEGIARLAAALEQRRRSALLWSAATALRQALAMPRRPHEQAESEQAIVTLRASLGEECFARAWAEGRALSLEEALALALEADPSG